jgi:hypothetical protein
VFDHLFLFPDEAAAHAALDPLGFGFPEQDDGEGGTYPAGWDGSCVLPCHIIIGREPRSATVDGETFEWEQDVYMAGFHINVATPSPRDDLMALEACVLVTDREKGQPGTPRSEFIILTRVSEETMNTVLGVTPVFAGTGYPFGQSDEAVLAQAAQSNT